VVTKGNLSERGHGYPAPSKGCSDAKNATILCENGKCVTKIVQSVYKST